MNPNNKPVSTPKQELQKQIKTKKQFRKTRTPKTNKQQALNTSVKHTETYKRKVPEQTFKSYIAQFFQNIVGEEEYKKQINKKEESNNLVKINIKKIPLSDNTPELFQYKKMILGSESDE